MNYSVYKDKATAKIKQYGSPCYVLRTFGEQYDEESDSYIGEEVKINGFALLSSFNTRDVDGTNIKLGDVNIMCVLDSKPQVEEKLVIGDTEYTIVNISECNPDGNCVIYYRVQGRK